MVLNERKRLAALIKKLSAEIAEKERTASKNKSAADELALEAEFSPDARKRQKALREEAEEILDSLPDKRRAIEQATARIAQIDAEEKEKARLQNVDALVDQARSTLAAYTDLHTFAGEFEKRRAIAEAEAQKLKDAGFKAGIGASVASMIKEARGRTVRWIMMAAAPEAARDLGLTQNLGKSRGHCGLLTTLQQANFDNWREIKTDAQVRAEKQEAAR